MGRAESNPLGAIRYSRSADAPTAGMPPPDIEVDGDANAAAKAAPSEGVDIGSGSPSATPGSDPWAKDGVYVRLSKKRKAKLREIAKRLGCDDSPHQAIVGHIERPEPDTADSDEPLASTALHSDIDLRFDELAKAVAGMEHRVAFLIERLGDALSPLTDLAHPEEPKPESLAAWLSKVQEERGSAVKKLALVRAAWIRTQSGQSGRLAMDFEMELLNVDGQPMRPVPVGRIQIDAVNPAWGFTTEAHANPGKRIVLTCQPGALGRWTVNAFHSKPDGSLGEKFAELSI